MTGRKMGEEELRRMLKHPPGCFFRIRELVYRFAIEPNEMNSYAIINSG
jgi:hypothetical protein